MMKLIFVVGTLVVGAFAAEESLSRAKRYAPFPFGGLFSGFPFGGGAYAGPGGAYAGAAAGAGPFWGPPAWNYPQRNYFPFSWVPFPVFPFPQNWYEGENVCKEVKTQNANTPDEFTEWLKDADSPNINSEFNHEQESCRGSNTKFVCIKRIFDSNGGGKLQATKYECCHGFVRNPNGPGCVENTNQQPNPEAPASPNDKVWYNIQSNDKNSKSSSNSNGVAKIDLKNILPTLRSMGATEFVSMADEASMTETLHTENYTIFCPLNSALESFIEDEQFYLENEVLDQPEDRRMEKKMLLHNLLTDHMTTGFHKLDDFRDKQVIEAAHQDSQIRMSIYYIPEKVVTANCVPVISGDHFARNGIIHVVERVLPVPSRSVADIIAGDAQFSVLKGMLSRAGLVQTLRNPNGTFTVFAPTDHAFSSSSLVHQTNDRCTASMMKHHVIDHVICSSAIPQFAKSLNMLGELLSLFRDEHNKLYVDDVQIVVRDIMATNGVVHVIDGLLSTRQAQSASQIMDEYGLKEFLSLIEAANLKSLYDSFENVTFFIPSDEAIQAIPPGLLNSLMNNIDSLFSILLYHVVDGQAELNKQEQILDSKLENTSVRVQVHASYPHATQQILVQCATVLSAGNKMCGGSLHVINKLLLPPQLSIVDVLSSLEGFSTLVLLLRSTGLDRRLSSPELGPYTLLAPTDDAFHLMGGHQLLMALMEDRGLAADILRMHIVAGTVCCSQLRSDLQSGRPQVRAIDGSVLKLDRDGGLRIGGSHIVDCDIVATNGVTHMVDTLVRQEDIALRTGADNLLIRI